MSRPSAAPPFAPYYGGPPPPPPAAMWPAPGHAHAHYPPPPPAPYYNPYAGAYPAPPPPHQHSHPHPHPHPHPQHAHPHPHPHPHPQHAHPHAHQHQHPHQRPPYVPPPPPHMAQIHHPHMHRGPAPPPPPASAHLSAPLPAAAPAPGPGPDLASGSSSQSQVRAQEPEQEQEHEHEHNVDAVDAAEQGQSAAAAAATEESAAVRVTPEWVISRHRYDVASAPPVVFSPRSRPPPNIVEDAIAYPPAPRPPKQKPRPVRRHSPGPRTVLHHVAAQHNPSPPSPSPPPPPSLPSSPPSLPSQPIPTVLERPSASETTSATSAAPETPTPHSPLSTNTSLSVSPPRIPSDLASPTPVSAPLKHADADDDGGVSESLAPSPAPAPAPAPALTKPAAKPQPKLWADLVKGSTKGSLPTSSVVGVSIPADARSFLVNASPAKRAATQSILQLLSAPQPASIAPQPSTIRSRGLINGGNLCFANAILQALVYCPPFHRLFAELGRLSISAGAQPAVPQQQQQKLRGAVGTRLGATPTPLVDATIHFLDEFAPTPTPVGTPNDSARSRSPTSSGAGLDSDAFVPTYIYDALKQKKRFDSMRRGHQEDAEEFLGFYLDTLEEELLALLGDLSPAASSSKQAAPKDEVIEETSSDAGVSEAGWTEVGRRQRAVVVTNIKTTESPISRIFGGKFRSVLRKPGSGRDSVIVQDWNRLQLDIQPQHVQNITDALRHVVAPEMVQVGGSSPDATKQVQLDTLPSVLVLHLKRFAYDATIPGGGGVIKNGKHIAFEPILELGNELMVPARRASNPTHIPRYRLFAVVYHHGQSATGGHYTLDVLHPVPGQANTPWVRLDDDIVTRVRPDDVFGQDGGDDKVAYLLFYRPVGPIR